MTILTTVLPVVTLILGYAGKAVTDARADSRAKRGRQEQDRRDFEFGNLKAVGPLLDQFMTASVTAFGLRLTAKESEPYVEGPHASDNGGDLDVSARAIWQELDRRAPLIFDEQVRLAVTAATMSIALLSVYEGSLDSGKDTRDDAHRNLNNAQQLVGTRIRHLYRADS